MKIRIADNDEPATRGEVVLASVIVFVAITILVMSIIFQPSQIISNKFSLEFKQQCWQANTDPSLSYTSPINLGNNTWMDATSNPQEKFLT